MLSSTTSDYDYHSDHLPPSEALADSGPHRPLTPGSEGIIHIYIYIYIYTYDKYNIYIYIYICVPMCVCM